MRRLTLIFITLAAVACGPNISTIRTGGLYPPKDDACHVTIENLDYQHATAAYDQIGLISVANGDLTDKVRARVRAKACQMAPTRSRSTRRRTSARRSSARSRSSSSSARRNPHSRPPPPCRKPESDEFASVATRFPG